MLRRPDRQVFLVALVLLGATGVVVERTPGPSPVGAAAGRLLTPVQAALSGAAAGLGGVLAGVRDFEALRGRNEALEARNAALEMEATKLDDLVRENRELRALLAFKRERVDLDLLGVSVVARVVAREPGNLIRTMKVDHGTADRVAKGMPVANERGLVGQVVRAAPAWSDVLLITDAASRVEGRIERTRETGMIFGTPSGELVMRFIPQNAPGEPPKVEVGDLVFTSGMSGRLPAMIPIGQVVEVHQADVETHQEAWLHPTVNFSALERVLVVSGWRPIGTAAEPDEAAAGESGAAPSRP